MASQPKQAKKRPVTLEEKGKLHDRLVTLPGPNLAAVIEILRRSCPAILRENEREIVLDFGVLDNDTHWYLEQITTECMERSFDILEDHVLY